MGQRLALIGAKWINMGKMTEIGKNLDYKISKNKGKGSKNG